MKLDTDWSWIYSLRGTSSLGKDRWPPQAPLIVCDSKIWSPLSYVRGMWPEPSAAQGLLLHCVKLCYLSLPGADWFRQNSLVLLAWKVRESQSCHHWSHGREDPFSFDHLAPLGWLFQCLETGDPISLCRVIKKHPPQPLASGLRYESSWVQVAKENLSYMSTREPKCHFHLEMVGSEKRAWELSSFGLRTKVTTVSFRALAVASSWGYRWSVCQGWCWLWVCLMWLLLSWGKFPQSPLSWEFSS